MGNHMFSSTYLIRVQQHRIYASFLPFHKNLAPMILIILLISSIPWHIAGLPFLPPPFPWQGSLGPCMGSDFPCQRLPLRVDTLTPTPWLRHSTPFPSCGCPMYLLCSSFSSSCWFTRFPLSPIKEAHHALSTKKARGWGREEKKKKEKRRSNAWCFFLKKKDRQIWWKFRFDKACVISGDMSVFYSMLCGLPFKLYVVKLLPFYVSNLL